MIRGRQTMIRAAMRRMWSIGPGPWRGDVRELRLERSDAWCEAVLAAPPPEIGERPANLLVEVTIEGTSELAGISFGPWKDFLQPVEPQANGRRLQLEIDEPENSWRFRCDGTIIPRGPGQSGLSSATELLDGSLTLKAHKAEELKFRELSLRRFESRCRLTVIIQCWRFAQRLRVALRNWCLQSVPSGALEVIVVNPQSPDATHEVIAAMAAAFPDVRVCELVLDRAVALDRGFMINRAAEQATGEWIWLTDADCVHPLDAASRVLADAGSAGKIRFVERRKLGRAATDALLAGASDAVRDFDAMAGSVPVADSYPWGYSQIVHRSVLRDVRYKEGGTGFDACDGEFVTACTKRGMNHARVDGLSCLHLTHPYSWKGTEQFL